MGCSDSRAALSSQSNRDIGADSPYVEPARADIEVGSQVAKVVQEHRPLVALIFGGPGTGKGKTIDHLCSMFGFQLISGEDLMLRSLPKKVKISRNVVLTTNREIMQFLEEEPHHLTIEWLFKLVLQELRAAPKEQSLFLIDLMPNLKFMLKNENLVKERCCEEIEKFEKNFPGTIALELELPFAIFFRNLTAHLNNANDPSSGAQTDEADAGKTQRRHALHENAARPFVAYYRKANRLVTIDARSGDTDSVWEAARHFIAERELPVKKHDDTVVFFNFEGVKENWEKIDMHSIKLEEIVPSPLSASVGDVLQFLARYIETTSCEWSKFVIDVEGTSLALTTAQEFKKAILFRSEPNGFLNNCLRELDRLTGNRSGSSLFKAFCSSENETLIFPKSSDEEMCRRLTVAFSETHREL
ncbi:uncharacterized protein [Oscarella lobularis]|uniref:uncharacterized protein n=1 Tax=Oscarella lobularis TaxID=121494 RepID=UPI00331430C9